MIGSLSLPRDRVPLMWLLTKQSQAVHTLFGLSSLLLYGPEAQVAVARADQQMVFSVTTP